MACSQAGRAMKYFTFSEKALQQSLTSFVTWAQDKKITVGLKEVILHSFPNPGRPNMDCYCGFQLENERKAAQGTCTEKIKACSQKGKASSWRLVQTLLFSFCQLPEQLQIIIIIIIIILVVVVVVTAVCHDPNVHRWAQWSSRLWCNRRKWGWLFRYSFHRRFSTWFTWLSKTGLVAVKLHKSLVVVEVLEEKMSIVLLSS